ncbi:hypothetical protein K469DRAFT_689312 [Zopfia rhizophila CBS 207.26]|uniref:Uncharacterized protein n=1 Tax=Zopfia rhizophila CBS 207.26 TaxID=1314779 RepID=A0A6A6ERU1_9PEZI|nr:hypothetical protein K469DRAFT_689312 [Zopfia rhizophila CBS 207.26]
MGPVAGVIDEFERRITLTPAGRKRDLPFNIVAQAVSLQHITNTTGGDVCGAKDASVPQSTESASPTNFPSTSFSTSNRDNGLPGAAKAGIGVGVTIAVLAILLATFLLWRRIRAVAERAEGDAAWSGMPELAADNVKKHERLAEKDGTSVVELSQDSIPLKLPADVQAYEIGSNVRDEGYSRG